MQPRVASSDVRTWTGPPALGVHDGGMDAGVRERWFCGKASSRKPGGYAARSRTAFRAYFCARFGRTHRKFHVC